MILGAAHRSPGIYLTAEEYPRKPHLGERRMKGLCDQSLHQIGVFFLQMRSVRSHSTSGREKEIMKKRMGNLYLIGEIIQHGHGQEKY
jgi:hypothetical protein